MPPDHDQRDQQHRPDLRAAPRPRLPDCAGTGGASSGAAAHGPGDRQHVEQRRHQARHKRRHEQLGDVLLGGDGVDDQDDRRRDEDAERAADRERAGREAGRRSRSAAAPAAPPGRRWPWSRPTSRRSRRTPCRRQITAIASPPRDAADKASRGREQAGATCRPLGERAHQDEQRDDRQRVVGELVVGSGLHVGEERRPARRWM